MTLSNNKTPPSQSRKKWLTLAVVAVALVLIPRRSSRQETSDNHPDCQSDSGQALNNPTDTPL